MQNPQFEEGQNSEVELQLIKMTSVSRDIRVVLQNILDSNQLDKKVDKELIKTFTIELESILENVKSFPIKTRKRPSFKVGEKITEAQEEEEHSGSFGLQFNNGKLGRQSLDNNELWQINQQLTEENEFLTTKLEEAEEYIKRIQQEQNGLEQELSGFRLNTKNDLDIKIPNSLKNDKEGLIPKLINENEELRQQLQQSKDFILKNNQDFVRELQKYNQKIWRLERDLDQCNGIIQDYQTKIEQYEIITSKLKQENFNLEIAVRNYKNYTNTDRSMRESNGWSQLERKSSQANKLRNVFRKQINGTSSYKNILG